MKERLQKILAKAGIASRRGAEELIRKGLVTVDGKTVTEMGIKVDPEAQCVKYKGSRVTIEEEPVYILLNKPRGYVTTLRDPQGRPIVTSLLKGVEQRVFPVGRLDLDTEGALLLTNDGPLAQKVQHPSYEVTKTYVARVKGRPDREKLTRLEKGIMLEGRRTWPAKLRILAKGKNHTTIEVIIHEGKKRQVRKMFAAIGNPVIDLKRMAYGGLQLGSLASGKFRFLTEEELDLIFTAS
jgi:23S rRNA pseudouridine2605 synthase